MTEPVYNMDRSQVASLSSKRANTFAKRSKEPNGKEQQDATLNDEGVDETFETLSREKPAQPDRSATIRDENDDENTNTKTLIDLPSLRPSLRSASQGKQSSTRKEAVSGHNPLRTRKPKPTGVVNMIQEENTVDEENDALWQKKGVEAKRKATVKPREATGSLGHYSIPPELELLVSREEEGDGGKQSQRLPSNESYGSQLYQRQRNRQPGRHSKRSDRKRSKRAKRPKSRSRKAKAEGSVKATFATRDDELDDAADKTDDASDGIFERVAMEHEDERGELLAGRRRTSFPFMQPINITRSPSPTSPISVMVQEHYTAALALILLLLILTISLGQLGLPATVTAAKSLFVTAIQILQVVINVLYLTVCRSLVSCRLLFNVLACEMKTEACQRFGVLCDTHCDWINDHQTWLDKVVHTKSYW